MSKQYKQNTAGYTVNFTGPETVEEFDAAAGASGSALEEAVANVIYRSTIPAFHDAFIPKLEELTGVKLGVDSAATERARQRAKTPEAAAKVKDVPEKFVAFNLRARHAFFVDENGEPLDEKSDAYKAKDKQLDDLAQSVADGVKVDPSPSARVSTPSKALMDKAESVLSRDPEKIEESVANLLAEVGDFDLERDEKGLPEQKSLARLIGAFTNALLAKAI